MHVGQDDLVAGGRAVARRRRTPIVGLSTHTVEQIDAALDEPVSYVAIGPVFGTATKATGYDAVGLERVRDAARAPRARRLPLVAIGGITLENAPSVLDAGATSVAVIGDLLVDRRSGRRACARTCAALAPAYNRDVASYDAAASA